MNPEAQHLYICGNGLFRFRIPFINQDIHVTLPISVYLRKLDRVLST